MTDLCVTVKYNNPGIHPSTHLQYHKIFIVTPIGSIIFFPTCGIWKLYTCACGFMLIWSKVLTLCWCVPVGFITFTLFLTLHFRKWSMYKVNVPTIELLESLVQNSFHNFHFPQYTYAVNTKNISDLHYTYCMYNKQNLWFMPTSVYGEFCMSETVCVMNLKWNVNAHVSEHTLLVKISGNTVRGPVKAWCIDQSTFSARDNLFKLVIL